jgi:hypothetical protein
MRLGLRPISAGERGPHSWEELRQRRSIECVSVPLVGGEGLGIVSSPVREKARDEDGPLEPFGPIPLRLKLPDGSGELPPHGIPKVERAVLPAGFDHD